MKIFVFGHIKKFAKKEVNLQLLAKRRASPGYARDRGFGSSGFLDFFDKLVLSIDFTDGTSAGTSQVAMSKHLPKRECLLREITQPFS